MRGSERVASFSKDLTNMAYSGKYGLADPLVSDIAKGVTVSVSLSLITTGQFPTIGSLVAPAAALTIYWYTVHQILP